MERSLSSPKRERLRAIGDYEISLGVDGDPDISVNRNSLDGKVVGNRLVGGSEQRVDIGTASTQRIRVIL
jgi:hypothetical protein